MNKPTLSVLIPTVIGRERLFNSLCKMLSKQGAGYPVEIITACDNKEVSIGYKRNELYKAANGEYSIQVDDDDLLAPDFIPVVLKYLKGKPDCVTYLESITENGQQRIACHSNRFKDWGTHVEGYHYVRTPYFKDVIKTSICQQIGVKDVRYGEDHIFAKELKASGLIKTEEHIPKVLYYYTTNSLNSKQHAERYGIR